jgi:DNA polymerase I-like protein with 3'-5' exonuclease and polymerase domains
MTSYYGTVTSRNTPSTAKFIFGSARWARSFIKPDHGMAVAYLDWSAQEYRVAASLSGDLEMLDDCQGDPYIRGAIRMSLAPKGATKSSHSALRGQFKVVALAALYGMGAATLAGRLGVHIRRANELLELHRLIYRRYWEWSGNVTSRAWGSGLLTSRYGWKFGLTDETKPTTVMNWHIQTAGAEMLRHALILAEANGVRVIALVHDALMIEAPVDQIHTEVARMRECMEVASTKLLENTRVPTSCEIIAHPDRYRDEKDREAEMWPRMNRLLEQVETRRNRGRIIVPASTF